MDREFNEIVRRSWGSRDRAVRPRAVPRPQGVVARPQNVVPSADVLVDGDDVLINLELPGVDVEKDVMVEIDRGALVVRGERSSEEEETVNGRVHRERCTARSVGSSRCRRTWTRPAISARYDRGVLTVRLAGAAAAPRSTRIPWPRRRLSGRSRPCGTTLERAPRPRTATSTPLPDRSASVPGRPVAPAGRGHAPPCEVPRVAAADEAGKLAREGRNPWPSAREDVTL
ncbi:Hsp20/alpha crystallin family protein [Frankia sp. CH37]|nr:Hsp20/alpha crystallin family protein [Parafrankia sp. CH37]